MVISHHNRKDLYHNGGLVRLALLSVFRIAQIKFCWVVVCFPSSKYVLCCHRRVWCECSSDGRIRRGSLLSLICDLVSRTHPAFVSRFAPWYFSILADESLLKRKLLHISFTSLYVFSTTCWADWRLFRGS